MPAPGTKQIQIEGRKVFMPAGEVELEEIIAAGLVAQRQLEDARANFELWKERAIEVATARRAGRKSVWLEAPRAGRARITFAAETKVLDEKVRALKSELPEAQFKAVFSETVTFKLNKGYRRFMETPQLPDSERLKARVGACLDVKDKAPSAKFFGTGEAATEELESDA